jgi:hypothetical protein
MLRYAPAIGASKWATRTGAQSVSDLVRLLRTGPKFEIGWLSLLEVGDHHDAVARGDAEHREEPIITPSPPLSPAPASRGRT